MPDDKPILLATLFCESVLEEANRTLSVIRIMDRVTVQIPADFPEGAKPLVHISGLIALRSGDFIGDAILEIFMNTPSGTRQRVQEFRLPLPGGHQGMNLKMDIKLGLESEGIYWFDVLVNQEHRSRMPLEVVFQRLQPDYPKRDEKQTDS
jgi:hypothetical protein